MLNDFMIWQRSLLQYVVRHKADPVMATALGLSDLNESVWRGTRQREKNDAKLRLKYGAHLSKQKCKKMSFTEKQLMEDYETKKRKSVYEMPLVKKSRHEAWLPDLTTGTWL